MSSPEDFDFSGYEDDEEESPKPKVKVPKELRDAYAAQGRRVKELEAELNQLKDAARKPKLAELLQSKGVHESRAAKVAALYPKDAEADETAVAAWLDEYADALGIDLAEGGGTTASPEDRDEITRHQAAVNNRPPASGRSDEAMRQQLLATKTPAEREALYSSWGVGRSMGSLPG